MNFRQRNALHFAAILIGVALLALREFESKNPGELRPFLREWTNHLSAISKSLEHLSARKPARIPKDIGPRLGRKIRKRIIGGRLDSI